MPRARPDLVRRLDDLRQDLRYGVRQLARNRGFTVVAVLTLGLGIGANTTIFSLIHAVLLRPLPFAEPDRLVSVWERRAGSNNASITVSAHEFAAWRERSRTFEQAALYERAAVNLTGGGEPQSTGVRRTTSEYFDVLGVQPLLGRAFLPGEDQAGRNRVAVLSHHLWQQRFGGDTAIIDKSVTLDDESHIVVGVMPPMSTTLEPDLYLPIDLPLATQRLGLHNLNVIARLMPGVTLDQAQADLSRIARELEAEMPGQTGHHVVAIRIRDDIVGNVRQPLARGRRIRAADRLCERRESDAGARRRTQARDGCARRARRQSAETDSPVVDRERPARRARWNGGPARCRVVDRAVPERFRSKHPAPRRRGRGPLGARRGRGTLAADRNLDRNRTRVPRFRHGAEPVAERRRTGIHGTRDPTPGQRVGRRGGRAGADPARRRRSADPELCEPGAGGPRLPHRQRRGDVGFAAGAAVPDAGITPAVLRLASRAIGRTARRRIGGGIVAIAAAPSGELDADQVEGRPPAEPGQESYAPSRVIAPGYFRTLGIPLRGGRSFRDADARIAVPVIRWFEEQPYPPRFDEPQPPPVAIVSEAFARETWPNDNPIGKRIRVIYSPWLTVVGVVGDVKHGSLDAPTYGHIYVPYVQEPWAFQDIVVRTHGDPSPMTAALRQQVRALDADIPVTVTTMDELVSNSVGQSRLYAFLTVAFGAVALALTLVGIFGVASYAVAQRVHEIGVRMALGAQRSDILRLAIGQGVLPAVLGVIAGVAGALALAQLIEHLLFGVTTTDPATFAAVCLVVIGAALLAAWLPARRAARVDPVLALRDP